MGNRSMLMLKDILAHVIDRIKTSYNPYQIILFGSYAKGTCGVDSDLDICIILDSDKKPVERRIEMDILFFDRIQAMDFIVWTPEELVQKKEANDDFANEIINNGVVIYERVG